LVCDAIQHGLLSFASPAYSSEFLYSEVALGASCFVFDYKRADSGSGSEQRKQFTGGCN